MWLMCGRQANPGALPADTTAPLAMGSVAHHFYNDHLAPCLKKETCNGEIEQYKNRIGRRHRVGVSRRRDGASMTPPYLALAATCVTLGSRRERPILRVS